MIMSDGSSAQTFESEQQQQQQQQHIILFYKYHPLSEDRVAVAPYQQALHRLCLSLDLTGRILIGCSKTEGINGTLAGTHSNVLAFTRALLRDDQHGVHDGEEEILFPHVQHDGVCETESIVAVEQFRRESKAFFDSIGEPELRMDSPDDFKWSCCTCPQYELFPDLNIKLTNELIGTGNLLSSIPLTETQKGYLTPKEWHQRLQQMDETTLLIDCRNTKEYEIGRFVGAIDPNTTTFAQFPKWVDDHQFELAGKSQILMYCTGGIRCEKASAYIRQKVPSVQSVCHLKGGIHKYLEEFGDAQNVDSADNVGSLWRGRNFVFDGRGGATGDETKLGKEGRALDSQEVNLTDNNNTTPCCRGAGEVIVGRCVACDDPFDRFDPHCVCTVCREPTLVCPRCQERLMEYHCRNHAHLRSCYFSDLHRFSRHELELQLRDLFQLLEDIAVGRRFRQKRKTILKQIERLQARLDTVGAEEVAVIETEHSIHQRQCRNCGEIGCSGRCWGFFGLKRKEILEKQRGDDTISALSISGTTVHSPREKPSQLTNKSRRDNGKAEIVALNASLPPDMYRDPKSGIRVPPCCTRMLQCSLKAKWCGQSLVTVVQNEFVELSRPAVLREVMANGLLKLNGKTVLESELSDRQLKSSDTIGRVLHWHEAPVQVPERIGVKRVRIPARIVETLGPGVIDDPFLYVCNKPSSVPVHPAGPYLANTLTLMVEAQEGLQPQSLKPLHRTDRVTSGLTLCCTNAALSTQFHKCLGEGGVDKLYLARVHGRFPSSATETHLIIQRNESFFEQCSWVQERNVLRIDAPVYTADPALGLRTVDVVGKPSQSLFRFLAFDEATDTSLVACFPVTGRNHQLRVHLQHVGFPIVNDIQYGGRSESDTSELTADSPIVQRILTTMNSPPQSGDDERRAELLSDSDVVAAKRACPCCRGGADGILQSFTRPQLLVVGHAIHLHAFRYRIKWRTNHKSHKTTGQHRNGLLEHLPVLAQMDLAVDPPDWANADALKNLDWLV